MDLSRRAFLLGSLAAAVTACGSPTTDASGGGPTSTGAATTGTSGAGGAGSTAGITSTTGAAAGSTTTGAAGRSSTTTKATSGPSSAPSTTTAASGPAAFVDQGPSGDKVALTFHTNGDLAMAQRLVDIFHDHGAVMTNFIVGNWLAANPSWAKKLVEAGHELANHTFTHPTFGSLSQKAMVDEIVRCRDTIAKLTGNGGRFFRPSGTDDGTATPSDAILRAAATAGYATVLGWNDEPYDYQDPGADAVRSRVLEQIQGGSIVSMHFGHQGTIDAMPAILDGISSKGLKTVTVSQLLG